MGRPSGGVLTEGRSGTRGLVDGVFEIKPGTLPATTMAKEGTGSVGANIQFVLVGNLVLYIRTGGTVLHNDV